jgi:type I restriction enzyme S subunit
MEALLQERLSIDKTNWTPVKFGEVVFEPKESTKDPIAEGIEHVVGLEHIESEDIHLRNSATLEEATTFTKRFSKGDVLFGRRRAYLKKAAQATFSGICSGDITVFRAKECLLPELLPFVVQNEKFFDFAIKHSAGGLSPRVKFKDLANYEFLLPPKGQQAQLAELLWAMDEVVESITRTLELLNIAFCSCREYEILKKGHTSLLTYNSRLKEEVNEQLQFLRLKDLLTDIRYGTSKKGNSCKNGVPVLGIPNVVNETISLDNLNYAELERKELESCKLVPGDIIIVRTNGNPDYTGKSALYNIDGGHAFASYLIKISVDNDIINPEFLVRFLQTKTARRYFKRHATSTAGNYNINTETIKAISIPVYPKERQMEIVTKLKAIELNLEGMSNCLSKSKFLQKSLINQVF